MEKRKWRIKKKPIIILALVILLIIILIINPLRIIAVNKLTSLGYTKEASKQIIKVGLKKEVLANEYSDFININVFDRGFNKLNYEVYKDIDYHQKIDVSLINSLISKDYQSSEVNLILKTGSVDEIKNLLDQKKISNIGDYLQYDYAKLGNLDRYITYKNTNGVSIEEAITNVNLSLDKDFYADYYEVEDFSWTMLVNKYNKLSNSFVPPELVAFNTKYCIGTCPMDNKTVVEAFEKMADDLYEEKKLNIYVNSAYRSYDEQEQIYNELTKLYGENYNVAKAGFSEHQTGLVVDIASGSSESFKGSQEEKWVKTNAYKYGFIFRYDSSKTKITGYNEPWHFRYVGDIAEDVYNSGLTFDEYYVKYLNK